MEIKGSPAFSAFNNFKIIIILQWGAKIINQNYYYSWNEENTVYMRFDESDYDDASNLAESFRL